MKQNETKMWVYAAWEFPEEAILMGFLTSQRVRGKEIISFEYTETWVNNQNPFLFLDPYLGFYKGKKIYQKRKITLGFFLIHRPTVGAGY
jgi:serine/threonine-protein kinase HipA